jgi:hypothetical protein
MLTVLEITRTGAHPSLLVSGPSTVPTDIFIQGGERNIAVTNPGFFRQDIQSIFWFAPQE